MIHTERLYLRRMKPTDYMDLYEYLSDPEVVRFEPYEPFTIKQCKAEARARSLSNAFWAVCLKDTDKVIGNLYFCPGEFNTYELGYVFNRQFQKCGYATEICEEFLRYAFQELNVRRIIASCSTENTSSWKLLERLHMRKEGCFLQNVSFKKDEAGNPIYFDSYQYAILKHEFDSLLQTEES